MTVGEVRTEASTSSPPTASALRVVLAACAAGVAPVVAGYLWMAVTGGGSTVEGFGFLALTVLWLVGGVVLIRLLRVRSLWLGVLVMLLPAVGALVDGQPLGTIFSLGMGFAIGAIAMRGKRMLAVGRVANRVFPFVALVASAGLIATSLPSPEDAVKVWTNASVIAEAEGRTPDRRYMVLASEEDVWPFGRGLEVMYARRSGWRWVLARSSLVQDPLQGEARVPPSRVDITNLWDAPTHPEAFMPSDCALPRILRVPWGELQGNCWLPGLGLIVGAAPARATILETTMRDGKTRRRPLSAVGSLGPVYVSRVFADRADLPPDAEPIRFAFRDGNGVLLDARPSMRAAYSWYATVARLSGAGECVGGNVVRRCPPSDSDPPHQRVYDAAVTLALLTSQEYRDHCRAEPPAGEWVLVARVDTKPDSVGIDGDAGRAFRPVSPTQVVVGMRQAGPFDRWLDTDSARVQRSDACFPGPSADPDLQP